MGGIFKKRPTGYPPTASLKKKLAGKAMKSTGAKAGKPLVGSSAAQAKRKLAIAKLKKGVKGPIERSSFSKAMAHREKAMFSKKTKVGKANRAALLTRKLGQRGKK